MNVSGRVLLVIGTLGAVVLFGFQNCAPQSARSLASTNGGKYPSPFAGNKVRLNEASFKSTAKQKTATQRSLKEKINLVLTINNSCAAAQCADQKNALTITCQHYKTESRSELQQSLQFYDDVPPSPGMTEADIQGWINGSTVDQACIVGVSESQTYSTGAAFNDTYYPQQSVYMDLTNFSTISQLYTKIKPVKVGIIDTGIQTGEPDLPAVQIYRDERNPSDVNFSGCASATPDHPNNGHGTFVAGIVAGTQNNNLGMAGIAPNAQLYAYMVGNCNGTLQTSEVANSIVAALNDGVEVVNMSLAAPGDDVAVREAIVSGLSSGMIFVVAAGNNGQDLGAYPEYPAVYSAEYQGVITVGATDQYGNLTSFSNFNPQYVTIAAPGQQVYSILSANFGSGYGPLDGTSFATPMVTAAVAVTLGYLKGNAINFDYSAMGIQNLIALTGSKSLTNLTDQVANGAFLDFNLLALAVKGGDPASLNDGVSITSKSISIVNGVPTVTINFSWNLATIPAGTKLGVFNISAGCNYSAPCLIQGLNFTGTTGSMQVQIPQDELVMMMAEPNNPNLPVNLSIAFYYPVYNLDGKQKNNPGVAAQTTVNLRVFDGSSQVPGSTLTGAVTNVRMDMQYFYVQGWVCLPGSNAAANVGLQMVSTHAAIPTESGYNYPLMIPHSGVEGGPPPHDQWNWNPVDPFPTYPGKATPPLEGAFMAGPISVYHKGASQYLSGYEGNPQLIATCKTLTASHAFELIVPIYEIANNGWAGSLFQVAASLGGQNAVLADPQGNSQFAFPVVNFQPTVTNSFTVNRSSTLTVNGNLCSASPSPVEVEASYSNIDFLYTVAGCTTCTLLAPGPAGFVYNPNLPAMGLLDMKDLGGGNIGRQTATVNPSNTDAFTKAYLQYTANPPNTEIEFDMSDPAFVTTVNAMGLLETGTGIPVTYINDIRAGNPGSQQAIDVAAGKTDRATISYSQEMSDEFINLRPYWDWYDVGEGFAVAEGIVGYTFDTSEPVGAYLQATFSVNQVLRETKKYETPLSAYVTVLGHALMSSSGSCGGGYQFALNSMAISNIANNYQGLSYQLQGFFKAGQPSFPYPTINLGNMTKVPLTLRFFQDGKLILHLETDQGSNFYPIAYPFQSADY